MQTIHQTLTKNWLVVSTPLKNMKVNWDDDISNNMWKQYQKCSSHHQPDDEINLIVKKHRDTTLQLDGASLLFAQLVHTTG